MKRKKRKRKRIYNSKAKLQWRNFLLVSTLQNYFFVNQVIYSMIAYFSYSCHLISHVDDRNKINTILPLE